MTGFVENEFCSMRWLSGATSNRRAATGVTYPGETVLMEASVLQGEFVTQDVPAMDLVDGRLAEPALAAHFASRSSLPRGHGLGEHLAKIEIATDTFGVDTIEAEHGFGVCGIYRVFDLPVLGDAFWAEVGEFHRQRFQLREFLRKAD